MRLERRVHDLLGAEAVLEDIRGRGEGGSVSPRRRWKSSATLVSRRPARCFRSGNVPAGFKHHARWPPNHRLDFVEHGRQRLVFDDRLRRLFSDMRVGGEHHRDRLPDMAHLALGEDRLVVKRGP